VDALSRGSQIRTVPSSDPSERLNYFGLPWPSKANIPTRVQPFQLPVKADRRHVVSMSIIASDRLIIAAVDIEYLNMWVSACVNSMVSLRGCFIKYAGILNLPLATIYPEIFAGF
jgi:hypothetical protein